MLLTRCPSCTTTFRITVALLRQASGQVRCGRCNHVFPAVAHLEEVPNEPDAHAIGSYSPRADEFSEPVAEPPESFADDLDETTEHEILTFHAAGTEPRSPGEQANEEVAPVTADELVHMFDSDPSGSWPSGSETRTTENRALAAPINPDESPDFELPPDIWHAVVESEGLTDAADDRPQAKALVPEEETDTGEAPWPAEGHESADATREQQPPAEWLDAQPAAEADALEDNLAETGSYHALASDDEATAADAEKPAPLEAAAPGASETEPDPAAAIAADRVTETDEDWLKKPAEPARAETEEDSAETSKEDWAEETGDDWAAAMAADLVTETDEDWLKKPAEPAGAETEEDSAEASKEDWAEETGDDWAAAMAEDRVSETDEDWLEKPVEPSGTETAEDFPGEIESDESAETDGDLIGLQQTRTEAAATAVQPWAGAAGDAGSPIDQRRRWRIAAAGLATLLMLQLAHHYRNSLASQALLGPVVQAVYATLGVGLAPNWDVAQYQINDWVAAAGPDQNGQNRLTITATLLNRGPRKQPHPYIRLELTDRWDESVGSRVFKPGEYLPRLPDPGELMAAGARVPAQLAVVDPGDDAYGFELDVCLPSGAKQLRCANDSVF
jgi:predicted Zn finger-like uncharacterized protein